MAAPKDAARGVAVLDAKRKEKELGLIRSDKGHVKACEHNARALLGAEARFDALHFDEFRHRIRVRDCDWTDHDAREALCWLQAEHQISGFTLGQVHNAVSALAYGRRRDALADHIRALPKWDGTERIEFAFHEAWGAPDSALIRAASRNFFIAAVARALKPGAQVDTVFIFEGPQGRLKSSSLRKLGGDFHAEVSAPIGTADFYRELRGLWIAELSELDSLRGKEASTVKRLLSATSDRFVEKYEKHATAYPRRAVFVATTNEGQYWQDSTGARRLVPIKTGEIRLDMIEVNREQWFAEGLYLFESGASWWEFPEIEAAQEERQQVDPWEDLLRGYMANGRAIARGRDAGQGDDLPASVPWPDGWIASAAIMHDWLSLAPHQQGPNCGARLGRVMRRLGYEPKRHGKSRERGWAPLADTSGAPQ